MVDKKASSEKKTASEEKAYSEKANKARVVSEGRTTDEKELLGDDTVSSESEIKQVEALKNRPISARITEEKETGEDRIVPLHELNALYAKGEKARKEEAANKKS